MLLTTIAGSLPKPAWLAEPNVLFAPWRMPAERLAEAQDDAVRLVLADQEEASIDIVTDGEQRRRHYVWGFLQGLTGIDTERLGRQNKGSEAGSHVSPLLFYAARASLIVIGTFRTCWLPSS